MPKKSVAQYFTASLTFDSLTLWRMMSCLQVNFALEDGIDDGALSAEFFTLLGKNIAKVSSVIQASEDSGLFWFSDDVSGSELSVMLGDKINTSLFTGGRVAQIGAIMAQLDKAVRY